MVTVIIIIASVLITALWYRNECFKHEMKVYEKLLKPLNGFDGNYGYFVFMNCTDFVNMKQPKSKTYKQFIFFGKPITYTTYPLAFSVNCNVENPNLSKKQVLSLIEHKMELPKRRKEIENGELI